LIQVLADRLLQALQEVEPLYYRLILLVGPAGSGRTAALRQVAEQVQGQVLNVNLALSERLLELGARQRVLRLPQVLEEIVRNAPEPLLLDNLEILFDAALQQDPLRLLQGLSRHRPVVATWNGTTDGTRLFYAEPGHPEHRRYDRAEALILCAGGPRPGDKTQTQGEVMA
jgi:hypothetical protein